MYTVVQQYFQMRAEYKREADKVTGIGLSGEKPHEVVLELLHIDAMQRLAQAVREQNR